MWVLAASNCRPALRKSASPASTSLSTVVRLRTMSRGLSLAFLRGRGRLFAAAGLLASAAINAEVSVIDGRVGDVAGKDEKDEAPGTLA